MFSRNMEPMTEMFPDLVKIFENQSFKSIILDGEVIGYDDSTESFLPFQETITRKRKHGVESAVESVPIKYFVFDILYLNGEDLTRLGLEKRLAKLWDLNFENNNGKIIFTESPKFDEVSKLDAYFRSSLDKGLEGVIVKSPGSHYRPGIRSYDWIKLKANTFAELKDSVDCVVMGYYHGRGQRAKHGIGGFLVGVYNKELDVYQTVAKVGSGVKDDEWGKYKKMLDDLKSNEKPTNYHVKKILEPDVYVYPEIVIEVDADEITLSKIHTAGIKSLEGEDPNELGYSLRFPRLKIFGRDKKPEDTTGVDELSKLFKMGKSEEDTNSNFK